MSPPDNVQEQRPHAMTWPERLGDERRLLAALFRWPRLVDLEPHHFLAPMHAALFSALDEVERTFPVESMATDRAYDDVGLELVVWCITRDKLLDLFRHVGGVRRYVLEELLPLEVTQESIADCVELVRVCPRCGR